MSDLRLTGKKILLVSPQRWDKVRVSKHHYALTLASLGNKVYFLNPPDSSIKGVELASGEVPGIQVVTYSPFFPLSIRFRFKSVFRALMNLQVRKLMRTLSEPIDIVWCFDPNLYHNLGHFNAPLKIFHPVDVFKNENAFRVARSADVLFSVSPSILDTFRPTGKPSYFVNHGLSEVFSRIATNVLSLNNEGKNICYVGNLLIPYMDRKLLMMLIKSFPDKVFHFIGPYEASSLGSGDEEARNFISYLESCRNVLLYGAKNTKEMCSIMEGMDAFILCYTGMKEGYDLSNSHKMLEYLSTGKPVISTPIKAYARYRHLIAMPPEEMPEAEYPLFFCNTFREISIMASPTLANDRKKLALDNTYLKQVQRINDILAKSKLI